MRDEPSEWDLIIIGAGIYGIQVARTFLELHPEKRLVVLEASGSIGGVWSKVRVYDDFWTQTPLGLLEFSDRPMHPVPEEDQYYSFFKAHHVASYLERYCESHAYHGMSLRSRIQTSEAVETVEKVKEAWHVRTRSGRLHKSPQLVDASGLTSVPNFPNLPGTELFRGTWIHHRDFANWERQLKENAREKVVVVGGAKSAADVAYACARSGQDVTWLIRRSGSGPAAFASAQGRMGYANSNESFYTRLTSLFLVSIFSLSMGYTRLLDMINKTATGRSFLRRIWQGINTKAHAEADYDRQDGKVNGFYHLKPDTELFWQNDSTGINQRADFFDTIARHVRVVREDPTRVMEAGLILQGGEVLDADVVICATGWKLSHPYFSGEESSALGLPTSREGSAGDYEAQFYKLDEEADHQITRKFPILDSDWARSNVKDDPSSREEMTALRLWKSIVPIHDQSIVFVGKLMLGNHFRAAEVQALFACGVLDGAVPLPSVAEMQEDVATTVAWCRRRYLKKGALGNWFYWDMVPYTDMLLQTMGLSSHRHASWWKDVFRPCFAKDLTGLIDEYRRKSSHK